MSLRLDALRRGKSRGTAAKTDSARPSASKTTHADAVLASLGYAKQPRRSGVSGQAIALIAVAAVLAGLGAWQGAVWLTSGARPTATPQSTKAATPTQAQPQSAAPPRFVPAPDGQTAAPQSSAGAVAGQAGAQAPATPPVAAPSSPPAQQQTVAERAQPVAPDPEPAAPMATPTRPAPPVRFEAAAEPDPAPAAPAAPLVTRRAATPPPRFIPASPAQSATQSAAEIEPVGAADREPPEPVVPPRSAAPAPAGRPPASGASEADHFKLALYYQQTGDFANALVEYTRVLERNDMNAEAHNNLGVLYQNKGMSEEAIREFRKAVAIDQKYAKGHNNLGVALLRSGQVDAAASEFRWLLDENPRNVDALVNLSLALKAGNRHDEAREYLLRALTVKATHPHVHYNLALLYEEDDLLVRAVEHYERFLQFATAEHATVTKDVRSKVANLKARLADIRAKGDK